MYQNGWPSKSYCLEKKISLHVTGSDLIRWSSVIAVLEDRETNQTDFPGGFENTHYGFEEVMLTSIGGLWKINMIPDHKTARKNRDFTIAKNWILPTTGELGRDPEPRGSFQT